MNPLYVLGVRTPVPGLLLAGQDAASLGVQGAFMGGFTAAAVVEPRPWRELADQHRDAGRGPVPVLVTLPRSRREIPRRPWEAMTIRSQRSRCAAMIISA